MRKNIILIIVLLFTCSFNYAQDIPEYGCTPSHTKAYLTVKFFLTEEHLEEERIETGTNNIPVEQIRHLEDILTCEKLDAIVSSNTLMQKIKADTSKTKYYYRTDDFYFIFWRNMNILMGPKKLIFIVNSNFEVVGQYHI